MGAYIKGMDMPKDCGECQFCHTQNFVQWCCLTGRENVLFDARPEWCPLIEAPEPSIETTKKKAKLKENGNWECPDVGCDECDHHRTVEWCSLAIPNHEEIDDTYKMVNEAFFEGFDAAEKRYRLLIETIEELDKKLSESVEVGEWIEREDWNGDNYYDCSVCGEPFVLFDGTPSMNLYHYCPNCGAKMYTSEGANDL